MFIRWCLIDVYKRQTKGVNSYYEFYEAGTVTFGSQVGSLPALSRKAYTVKVLDETLIDNDKTWIYQVVENGKPTYYKAMTEAEGTAAGLEKARFFFKSDEIMGEAETETYVLIKTDGTTANAAISQASLESTSKLAYDDLNNIPSEPSSTFAIALADVKLYRELTADKTVKFFLKRGLRNDCDNGSSLMAEQAFGCLLYTAWPAGIQGRRCRECRRR